MYVVFFFVARGGKMCALSRAAEFGAFFFAKAKSREMEKNSVERSLSSKLVDTQITKQIVATKKK